MKNKNHHAVGILNRPSNKPGDIVKRLVADVKSNIHLIVTGLLICVLVGSCVAITNSDAYEKAAEKTAQRRKEVNLRRNIDMLQKMYDARRAVPVKIVD